MSLAAPWRIAYGSRNGFPAGDLSFGTYETGLLFTKMPVLDSAEFTSGDRNIPRGDGGRFGRDTKGMRVITFEVEAVLENEATARVLLDRAANVWDAAAVRSTDGAVAALTAHTGRVAFGRPRKWLPDDERIHHGRATIGAEFETIDDLWYGTQQVETVNLVPDLQGGLVAPLAAPLLTTADSNRSTRFVVGGTKPTWPVVTIYGPIINPVVEVVGVWRYGFQTTLAYDESITLDLRPFGRTILRNNSGNVVTDAASSRILAAAIPPGAHELVLRGTALTGTPSARLAWRDTFNHW